MTPAENSGELEGGQVVRFSGQDGYSEFCFHSSKPCVENRLKAISAINYSYLFLLVGVEGMGLSDGRHGVHAEI